MIGAIDRVTILSMDTTHGTDAEGMVTRDHDEVEVLGRVDEVSARDVEIAAQIGQRSDVVVKVDLDVAITDQDSVVVSTPVRLAGTYRVDAVRTTRRHLRVLCSRTTIADY